MNGQRGCGTETNQLDFNENYNRVKFAQSCLTLCDPMDCSLPGSSVRGISQQEYWSGVPFPPPGNLPDPGIEPVPPALAGRFFITAPPGSPCFNKNPNKLMHCNLLIYPLNLFLKKIFFSFIFSVNVLRVFFILAMLLGMRDLSFPSRDWTCREFPWVNFTEGL